MKTFRKQPSEILDYDIDMSPWFETIPGDQINSVSITSAPAGLDVPPTGFPVQVLLGTPASGFKVWVGGGTDGELYKITAVVKTTANRTKEVDFRIQVLDQ